MAHCIITLFISKKLLEGIINSIFICTHKTQSPSRYTFWAFGCIAHDEYGFAERWGFFLYAARICKYEIRVGHDIMEVQHLERFDDTYAFTSAKLCGSRLTYQWIHVDWIQCFYIGILIHNAAYGAEHLMHGLAEIFPSVCSDKDETATHRPLKSRMGIVVTYGSFQGIDSCITCDKNTFGRTAFSQEILF